MLYSPRATRASRARLQSPFVPHLPPLRPVVVACVLAWSAGGALACDAGDTASLAACISNVATDSTINLTGNITLTGNIGVLAGNATINGNGHTLDGADTHRGFFVASGTVNINNLVLANLRAAGGAGGTETNPGGGGMGAGGAVFVRSGAAVTLDSVQLLDNSAVGGDAGARVAGLVQSAGGGGMGGAGGSNGTAGGVLSGHGGGGLFEPGSLSTPGPVGGVGGGPNGGAGGNASSGLPGGDYSGGGGGGSGQHSGGSGGFGGGGGGAGSACSTTASGGAGGFGGGGGGAACAAGGAGGFGGGGGSGGVNGSPGGAGGFGGGAGTDNSGAGGGAGMGGAVFVQEGGALTVAGTTSLGGNSVAAGAGSNGGGAGSAFGSGIFLQGAGGTLNFGNGNQVVSDVIADQAGSGGAGASSVAKTGSGTLRLEAANTYTGGTTLSAGTVEIANTGALGTGTVRLAGGALRVDTSGTVANNLVFAANQDSTLSAAAGETVRLTGHMRIDNASGAPTVARFGSTTDTGTIVVDAIGAGIFLADPSAPYPALVVAGGTLRAGNNILGFFTSNAASTTIEAGATLDFDGRNAAIGNLQGSGTVLNTASTTVGAGNFAGSIAGAGSLVKNNTGTLVLTGDNTYSGGTTITGGTLQVGDGGTTGSLGSGAITNNASLVFNRSDNVTVDEVISGTGTLTQAGSGTLRLEAANSYAGGTTLSAGTMEIADTGALGTGAVTLAGGALRVDTSGSLANRFSFGANQDSTFSAAAGQTVRLTGQITASAADGAPTVMRFGSATDTGTIVVDATGASINLTGPSAPYPALVVAGGTLRAANNVLGFFTFNATSTTVDAGATLDFDGRNSFISNLQGSGTVLNTATTTVRAGDFAGTIAGTGDLAKDTAGTLVLAGNNTYSGSTTISGGTLQVGNGGTTGNLGSGAITNNASLVFNRGNTLTVGQAISGTGSVTQAGSGTTIFTGDNNYNGTTTIQQGTLQVGNGGTSGSLGLGAVVNDGALAFIRSDAIVVGSAISGSGSLTQGGSGTLRLEGNNTYSGGTTVGAGTLEFIDASALGTGDVTLAGGTLRAAASSTLSNDLVFAANRTSTVSAAAGQTLNLTGGVTVANAAGAPTVMRFGSAGETGTVVYSASGNSITTGAGAPLHQVVLAGGTLRAGNSSFAGLALQAAGVTVDAGATLDLNGHATDIASLAGAGRVQNSAATSVGGGNFAGTLEGTGSLTKYGTGTLVLTGNSTYGGGTTIHQGTLQVGNGGAGGTLGAGGVTNDSSLVFFRSDTFTVGNAISGTGTLQKAGAGTMVLAGNNTYQGTTTISAGTLQVGAGATAGSLGSGAVVNDGALVFNRSDALTVGNAISGVGALTQAGTGTTILSSDNSYQGTTTITGGTLQVGAGGTVGSLGAGNVANNGTLAFNRSDDVTLDKVITGTGTLAQAGSGKLTLAGGNSYGATVISAGTLQVGDGGTTGSLGSGNVTNNGALAFNRSDTVSLANVISGTGSLTQSGSGNLVLTGANTYTGGTFVNAGTLSVNGSIVGNTTVNNGGTLGGSGTVGSIMVNSGGTLAPGNSIGTLTAAGNLAFAPGSVYRVEANAAGAADRVNAVGAGTITINGGTVDVQAGGAGYQRNTAYTILSSGGATTGQFDSVTSNLAFLTPTLIYSANGVALNLQASDALNYASAARTPNQTAVANYLQGIANTPGAAAALIQQIDNMTADQAAASFESMAGSAHASASQVASALGRNFSATLASRSGFGTSGLGNAMNDWSQVRYASLAPVATSLASSQGRGLWAQALGAGGRVDSDGNAAGSRYRNSGLVLGYDQPVTGQWLAGGAVGYSTSWWNATSGDPSSGKVESPQAGLYARYTTDSIRVRIDGTFSSHDFTTDRTVNIAGVGATANSKHKGREWGLAGQLEMPIKAGDWEVRPLAGLRYAHLNEDGFSETGQSPANLAVAERTTQNTLLSAGMHFVRPFNQGKAGLELRAVASHLAGDNDSPVTASLIGQPGSFTATGVPLERNALTLGTTVLGQFTRNVSAYLDANYEVRGSGQSAYQLTGGVRVTF